MGHNSPGHVQVAQGEQHIQLRIAFLGSLVTKINLSSFAPVGIPLQKKQDLPIVMRGRFCDLVNKFEIA
jgi:hypothetical protein